jgi:hypothetical protein
MDREIDTIIQYLARSVWEYRNCRRNDNPVRFRSWFMDHVAFLPESY